MNVMIQVLFVYNIASLVEAAAAATATTTTTTTTTAVAAAHRTSRQAPPRDGIPNNNIIILIYYTVVKASRRWKCSRAGGACAPKTACETYSRQRFVAGEAKKTPRQRENRPPSCFPTSPCTYHYVTWCLYTLRRWYNIVTPPRRR